VDVLGAPAEVPGHLVHAHLRAGTIDYWEFDPRAKFGALITGVEYSFVPQPRFSPDVEWASYGKLPNGSSLEGDVILRATFCVTFP